MAPQSAATEFPLPLCQVLEEEIEALLASAAPGAPAGTAAPSEPDLSWEFAPAEIRTGELPGLLARLHEPGDEVCRRLRKRLSPEFCARLAQVGKEGGPRARDLLEPLAAELNRLLGEETLRPGATEDLAQACRIEGIHLSDDLQRLIAHPPADRKRLLRLLLEEVFPAELEPQNERRLQSVYRRIHADSHGLAALCLSGGGIRSAVFGLGVLQGLARRGLLHSFDYLSTVSGGGYLGGLLSAWIHRHPRGLDGVSDELSGARPGAHKLEPEAAPLEYMRNFSNYLSPKLGILSADSWTLISIFVRNLYVYWLVLVPLLLAVLALPRLFVALCSAEIRPLVSLGTQALSGNEVFLFPDGVFVLASILMGVAIGYVGWNRPSGGRLSTTRGFFFGCLLPLVASAILFALYWSWYPTLGRPAPTWHWFVFPTVAINVFGWSVHAVSALARGRVRFFAKIKEVPILVAAGAAGGALTMLAARLFENPADPQKLAEASRWSDPAVLWYGVFAVPCVLGAFVFGETLFAGLVSRWTDDEDREWWSRSAAWLLLVVAIWIAISGVVIFGPVLLAYWKWILTPVGGLAGLATALLARSSLTAESHGAKDKESPVAKVLDGALAFAAPIFVAILTSALSFAATWLFHVASFGGLPVISGATPAERADALALFHANLVSLTTVEAMLAFLVLTFGGGMLMALLIDINKFSLHAMYRNRLIRTFLGASRSTRRPNAFTGFDGEDNLEAWRLRCPLFLRPENLEAQGSRLCLRLKEGTRPPSSAILSRHLGEETRELLAAYAYPAAPSAALLGALAEDLNRLIRGRFDQALLSDLAVSDEEREQLRRARSDDERHRLQRDLLLRAFQEEIDICRPPKPLHVVNVALNLVGGKRLAWQQRKAQSFTFSPLHCGSFRLGYRPSDAYALGGGSRRRAISLGTAIAISGAAASPNMGYHSSPAITFLMTFFNARLGWWLGNPGAAGSRTFGRAQPDLAVGPLISEALGLTDDRNPYVYLSDGGHFENLGLYEMVLRRCRYVVVVDAGQDHDCHFEDLGNALRKIRIDLGVRIQLGKLPIWAEVPQGETGRYCAVGTILYSEVDDTEVDGCLLYLKPAVYDCGEPQDVLHYKKLNPLFPHESTGDQWFGEQQFESYRALGLHAIETICDAAGDGKIDSLPELFDTARRYLGIEERQEAREEPGERKEPKEREENTAPPRGPVRAVEAA